jgi:hypothetical protein
MRYKLLGALVFISCAANAQQINPVPDYVFANRMSVGRNAVTDTLAYFSIGPRYGAIRGFMPPMVVDTALVTGGTKRNGLTIFSIQKNKYVYWDSVGSKWAEMAGTGGTAINSGDTASMLSPYTRGSGTTNYLPKFTGTRTLGNSLIVDNGNNVGVGVTSPLITPFTVAVRQSTPTRGMSVQSRDFDSATTTGSYLQIGLKAATGNSNATIESYRAGTTTANNIEIQPLSGEVLIGGSTDNGDYKLQISGAIYNTADAILAATSGYVGIGVTNPSTKLEVLASGDIAKLSSSASNSLIQMTNQATTADIIYRMRQNAGAGNFYDIRYYGTDNAFSLEYGGNKKLTINSSGEILINNATDAGAYALQVAGSIYNTTGAVFAASSGNVGIGTSSPNQKLTVVGNINFPGGGYSLIYGSTDANTRISGDNTAGLSFLDFRTAGSTRLYITDGGDVLVNTASDAGAYAFQVSGAIYNTTTLTTGAPTSGSAKPWRLGEAATVSPTSPNRTIRVEIDGTVYYIHAKTTND